VGIACGDDLTPSPSGPLVSDPTEDAQLTVDSPRVIEACNKLGWPGLRPVQKEVMQPLFAGRNVVAVLPTSSGKSGIYQVPALAREGMVIVVSPLIALMIDQVDTLLKRDVRAGAMHSMCSDIVKRKTLEQAKAGELDILYLSPERMLRMDRKTFSAVNIQLIAVDEAHCISEWGYDFRPAYMRLGKMIRMFGADQVIALTATATKQVAKDIADVLGVADRCERMRYSPDRPNISYMVAGSDVSLERMVRRTGLPCLIYGGTRASVELGSNELRSQGFSCMAYHAGLTKTIRRDVQEKFLNQEIDLIVATCAFGMGIDHAGIRGVIHMEMPSSLEAYTQEAGRAGRDGSPSLAICRATMDTLEISRSMVSITWPHPREVFRIWELLQRRFDVEGPKYGLKNQVSMTIKGLAEDIGENPSILSSCLRILSDSGAIRRLSYQQRPVTIHLNAGVRKLRSKKQIEVMRALWENATPDGLVVASVAYLRNELGVDQQVARRLRMANAIRYEWAEKCQVMERTVDGRPELDIDRIRAIHARSLRRIDLAKGFLTTTGCRRDYLLGYFGDLSGGRSLGVCCDRCHTKSGAVAVPQSDCSNERGWVSNVDSYLTNRKIAVDDELISEISSLYSGELWGCLSDFIASFPKHALSDMKPPDVRMRENIIIQGNGDPRWVLVSGMFIAKAMEAVNSPLISVEGVSLAEVLAAIVVHGTGSKASVVEIGSDLLDRCVDAVDGSLLSGWRLHFVELCVDGTRIGVQLVDAALEIALEGVAHG